MPTTKKRERRLKLIKLDIKKEFLQHCPVKSGSPGKIFKTFIQMVCKNLEVMNTFLNAYDLSKLKPKDIDYSYFLNQSIYLLGREEKAKEGKEEQEEISNINNLNKFLTCNEIEAVSPQ